MGSWVGKLALLLATFTAILVVAEASLRVAGALSEGSPHFGDAMRGPSDGASQSRLDSDGPIRSRRARVVQVSDNPLLQYELRPGAVIGRDSANSVVNSRGFRGPEPMPEPYAGRRIAILGDSIAYGFVRDKLGFAHKLQQRIDPEREEFEVLNLAVGGYDTLQEVAMLEDRGLAYEPELVVLVYCLNDLGVVSVNLSLAREATGTTAVESEVESKVESKVESEVESKVESKVESDGWEPSRWLSDLRIAEWLQRKLAGYRARQQLAAVNELAAFRDSYADRIAPIGDEERELLALMAGAPDRHPSSWYRDRERVGRLRFAFEWLEALAVSEAFEVLVVVVPFLELDAGQYRHDVAHQVVAHEAQRTGFALLDLRQSFVEAGLETMRLSPDDPVHPKPQGHSLMAAAVHDWIRDHSGLGVE